jgi:yecA family protein
MSDWVDLDLLDHFLMSDAAPDNGMALSDLDGFLTGILVGPDLIMPSEWLPHVWGGEEPVFEGTNRRGKSWGRSWAATMKSPKAWMVIATT